VVVGRNFRQVSSTSCLEPKQEDVAESAAQTGGVVSYQWSRAGVFAPLDATSLWGTRPLRRAT
jgi:hypothetical protein